MSRIFKSIFSIIFGFIIIIIIKIIFLVVEVSGVIGVWLNETRTNMINEGTETDTKQIVSYSHAPSKVFNE